MKKSEDKLVFTPTFFWEDITYVLQLIGKFFKMLIEKISGKGADEDPADGE